MADTPLLDTNPILRHILGDNADHSPRAHTLFERIARGDLTVRTVDTVIFEAVFTMEKLYKIPRPAIRQHMLDLLRLPGIVLPGKRSYPKVFDLWVQHRGLSFADAFHAVTVQRLHLPSIISFDQYFDRLPGITRQEP